MSDGRRIDFFVIGSQIGAASDLLAHLSNDPSLNVSLARDVHFFDSEAVDWKAPDYGHYHDQFDWVDRRIRGEATEIYAYWPSSLERIADYRPDTRLIFMLGDPVDRAWDHWCMEFRSGSETLPFSQAIRRGRQRLFDAEPWGHHRAFSYVEQGFYADQLERLLGLFAPEQVLILEQDEICATPERAMNRIGDFVGASSSLSSRPRPAFISDDNCMMDEADKLLLEAVYARDQSRLRTLLASLK